MDYSESDNIVNINKTNSTVINNLIKFNEILKSIELTINDKIKNLELETYLIKKSIDSNVELFESICDNM